MYAGKWLFGWCRQVMGLYARVNGWLATKGNSWFGYKGNNPIECKAI